MDSDDEFGNLDDDLLVNALIEAESQVLLPPKSSKPIPVPAKKPNQQKISFKPVEATLSERKRINTLESHHETDPIALKTWIYPVNYQPRMYQFNISSCALFNNTLVCLPTGLGKTFIAAVVIYNYFRWFKKGKIVFVAPTKPLVNQQIEACYKITGLSSGVTCEMTGNINVEKRRVLWQEKRVFYLTPETVRNDLANGLVDPLDIILVVFDEAHRAQGKYAYCEMIKELESAEAVFRVLALSATPGSSAAVVQHVVQNLLIEKFQLRTEESPDVKEFSHDKVIEEILVTPNTLMEKVQTAFIQFPQKILDQLVKAKAFHMDNPLLVSPYSIILALQKFGKNRTFHDPKLHNILSAQFMLSLDLIRALETLQLCGLRGFYEQMNEFVQNVRQNTKASKSKLEIVNSHAFMKIMEEIKVAMLDPAFESHPKMKQLDIVVQQHFKEHPDSKVMVFSSLRTTVEELVTNLAKFGSLIRPTPFVGQAKSGKRGASGMKQKDQQMVIENFKKGVYNVLVATCIGEEGLDIGELDLIICFDNQKSPIRMLQRCGRTGRQKEGKIVLLINRGKEEQAVRNSRSSYKSVQKSISEKNMTFYGGRLAAVFPPEVDPSEIQCEKLVLHIPEDVKLSKKVKNATEKKWLDDALEKEYVKRSNLSDIMDIRKLDFSKYPSWQVEELPKSLVERTAKSKAFLKLMKRLDHLKEVEEPVRPSQIMTSQNVTEMVLSNPKKRKSRIIVYHIDDFSSASSDFDDIPSRRISKSGPSSARLLDQVVESSDDDFGIGFIKGSKIVQADRKGKSKAEINGDSDEFDFGYSNAPQEHDDDGARGFTFDDDKHISTEKEAIIEGNLEVEKESFAERLFMFESQILFEDNHVSHKFAETKCLVDPRSFEFTETQVLMDVEMEIPPETQFLVEEPGSKAPESILILDYDEEMGKNVKQSVPNVNAAPDYDSEDFGSIDLADLRAVEMAEASFFAANDPIMIPPTPLPPSKPPLSDMYRPAPIKSTPQAKMQQKSKKGNPMIFKTPAPRNLIEKIRKRPLKNMLAQKYGLVDYEVGVLSDVDVSEDEVGSDLDSDLSGFITKSPLTGSNGKGISFYRHLKESDSPREWRVVGNTGLQHTPGYRREGRNIADDEDMESLESFINDSIEYEEDGNSIFQLDQNTQDLESQEERDIQNKQSKKIDQLELEDLLDF